MFISDKDWFELESLVDKNWQTFSKMGKHNIADELVEFLDKITHQGTENQIEEEPDKPVAVVTFGRFQPPHLGHQRIFKEMAAIAREQDHLYVFTTSSFDKENNPLKVEKKVELIQTVFPVQVVVATNFTDMLSQLNGYYDTVRIFLGDDHQEFQGIAERYNNQPDKKGNVLYSFQNLDFHFIERNGISGTLVRKRIRAEQPTEGLLDKRVAEEVQYLI